MLFPSYPPDDYRQTCELCCNYCPLSMADSRGIGRALRRETNAPTASCAASTVVGATSSTLAPMPLTGDHEGDGEVVLEGWLLKTPRHGTAATPTHF